MFAVVAGLAGRVGVFMFVCLSLAEGAESAPDRRLWGSLEAGPHPVGFSRSWQLDHARQYAPALRKEGDGSGPAPECPRPILVNLWYPSQKSDAAPMRYRDYLAISSDHPLIAPFAKRLEAFTRRTIAEEILEERPAKIDDTEAKGIERLLDATTYAVKDAPVAHGKFPLIVGHAGLGGTFEDNSVFYEYLASHGYVVVVAPYQSENAAYLNIDWDLDRSIKDMDFLVRYVKARPEFDLGAIGAIGQSYGAQAVLAWRAEKNSPLGAVVSLDSTVEYSPPAGPSFAQLKPRLASAERLAGPVMVYAQSDGKPDFAGHWAHLKYTRLYTVAVADLEHNDFISQGSTRFAFVPGQGADPKKAAVIRANYDRVCLNTRKFFDAYLRGDLEAGLFLKQTAQGAKSEKIGLTLTIREPEPLPPTGGQFVDLALQNGIDAAMSMARRFGRGLSEETLGDAGFGLCSAGKPADGVAFMRFRCELYPSSWGAQKLLADRLLDEGDRAGALAAYRKAEELIASGVKPTPMEWTRKMIANGIKKAEGK